MKISLFEIETKLKNLDYLQLYQFIMAQLESGKLSVIKSAKTNGKKPSLPLAYWINPPEKDMGALIEELRYEIHPRLNNQYYLKNLTLYENDREHVLKLSHFLTNYPHYKKQAVSVNERSYEIWQREKFLQSEGGVKILKNLDLTKADLFVYETAEPIAYYSRTKEEGQSILIIENKDTFFSMRKHLISGAATICGTKFSTLIYGGGKKVSKAFSEFELSVEPYLLHSENNFYYFGDLDYEGLGIYEQLINVVDFKIMPFYSAYQKMLTKATGLKLAKTKRGQKANEGLSFYEGFSNSDVQGIKSMLASGHYIPQEILQIGDY